MDLSDTRRSTSTREARLQEVEVRCISRDYCCFFHSAALGGFLDRLATPDSWDDSGMESGYLDQGIAGSITMITLTLATVILLRSFYKRYKRMEQRRIEDERK